MPMVMSCREFLPGIERFCPNQKDFVNSGEVVEMATFFGIKGTELTKVKLMAAREVSARLLAAGKRATRTRPYQHPPMSPYS